MASSSSLSLPLQLGRYASSSSRLGLSALRQPTSSVRLRPTRGQPLSPIVVAVGSYDHARVAAGHGDNGGGAAAASALRLRQVMDETAAAAELRAARVGRAHEPSKGRPGDPREGDGGKVHAAPPTSAAKRVLGGPKPPGLPAEGSGGHGGSIH